jgi:1-acyl-sn-glycerol-3-phosphate acyltransferase
MFNFMPGIFTFVIGCATLILITIMSALYIVPIKLIWFVMPFAKLKHKLAKRLSVGMSFWQRGNRFIINLISRPKLEVRGLEGLSEDKWYLLVCNHMSGFDIAVLSYVFQDKIPPAKYFLKRELLYVPFLGIACWALGMAFITRYSPTQMRKKKKIKNNSLVSTRKACRHFKQFPTTVINFLEGGRFTKKKNKNSPFKHLLKPKAGGIALTLGALDNQFDKLLNVTLVYPSHHQQENILFSFLMGRLDKIVVHIEILDVPAVDYAEYLSDVHYRVNFQKWLNSLWSDKDKLIQQIMDNYKKNSQASAPKRLIPISAAHEDLTKSGL